MYWMYAIVENTVENETPSYITYKGDSGNMCVAINRDDEGNIKFQHTDKPIVGCSMRVGSMYARSFSDQDYWTTTPVTEIIKEWTDENKEDLTYNCIFKTKNSVYHFKAH